MEGDDIAVAQAKLRPTFAMVADANYLNQVETLLKSIYYHVPQAACYVINGDLPDRWFKRLRSRIQDFGGELHDCKIDPHRFDHLPTLQGISAIAYARFLVADLVPADRVVYLDVDTLVTADLQPLFSLDLAGKPIAAAYDMVGETGVDPDHFNSGVMVLDLKARREQGITSDLLAYLDQRGDQITFQDQQVLNEFFGHNFTRIDKRYNFMLMDQWQTMYDTPGYSQLSLDPLPAVIHYIGFRKPWKYKSMGRTHDLWWAYRDLEWTQIRDKWQLAPTASLQVPADSRPMLLNLTNVMEVEGLEELLQRLPDYRIVVTAWTAVGSALQRLRSYDNFELIEGITPPLLEELEKQAQGYLDTNYGEKLSVIRDWAAQADVPVFGFEDQDNLAKALVVPTRDIDAMADLIRNTIPREEN